MLACGEFSAVRLWNDGPRYAPDLATGRAEP